MEDSIKAKLLTACYKYASEKTEYLQRAIRDLQDSANEETKSSAGDKYETGRAMAQLEIEKLAAQLHDVSSLRNTLDKIATRQDETNIMLGSVVQTNNGNYFIAISAGNFVVGGQSYFAVGGHTPLALALKGRKSGDVDEFNKKIITILSVAN